jgi:hypothetical protein
MLSIKQPEQGYEETSRSPLAGIHAGRSFRRYSRDMRVGSSLPPTIDAAKGLSQPHELQQ